MGLDSSVGIATELWSGRCVDRIPVVARFSAPAQTGPGSYPASCTMCTGSFSGVNRAGRDVDHPPLSSAEVKGRVELYLYSSSGPSSLVLGWALPFTVNIMYCTFQSVITFGEKNMAYCDKLDRQGYHISDHLRH
jgi:hypothetical protein